MCFPAKDNFFHFKHGEDPNAIRLRVHDPIELHDLCIELPGLVCAFALSVISFDRDWELKLLEIIIKFYKKTSRRTYERERSFRPEQK